MPGRPWDGNPRRGSGISPPRELPVVGEESEFALPAHRHSHAGHAVDRGCHRAVEAVPHRGARRSCSATGARASTSSYRDRAALPNDHPPVDAHVHEEHESAEDHLHGPGERRGVQHRHEVARDEARGVAATARPEPALQGCERAHPVCPLDQHAPRCRGDVRPGDARPAQRQEPYLSSGDGRRDREARKSVSRVAGGPGSDRQGYVNFGA